MAPFHHSPYNSPRTYLAAKLDNADDDKQSLISRSSGTPRAEQGHDTLRLVAGNRVRHARCAPEYLEDMAVKGIPESVRKAVSQKFKVIAGQEARTYFKNYVECVSITVPPRPRSTDVDAPTDNTERKSRPPHEKITTQ